MHQNPAPGTASAPTDALTSERTVVIVNAGTSDPSSTKMLADRIATRTTEIAADRGLTVHLRSINLRPLATDITSALVSGLVSPELQAAYDLLHTADAIVAATPVYKAGPSGLFTGFFQAADNDLLIGIPVVLAATGGSDRHALVIDEQIRSLFAYLRTLTLPTSVYATPDDWQSRGFGSRIDRAATELTLLLTANFTRQLRDTTWNTYQHSYGSAGGTELDIDLSSDLMRLATGGQ